MIRKLLVLAAAAATLSVLALAGGVSQAKADTIMFYKAKPDLVVNYAYGYQFSVENVSDRYYPTATAGAFWINVSSRKCADWYFTWCASWERLPEQYFYVPSLAAGAYAWFNIAYEPDEVQITVDVWQSVAERDEYNNTYHAYW
jgi:hypothetical protein